MREADVQTAASQFPPAVRATIEWLQGRYAAWYRANPPPMPDRFTRREFGYILWPERPGPPPFVRHRAYEDAARFHGYLQWAGPHSVYYSTAYYRRPGEMKMADKQWLGAELIFDLDADHLADVEQAKAQGREMDLASQLAAVKSQFKRLLDEFLFGDFGLSEDDVWITFSGGRGYHAHVTESRLMRMGSKERREVVDYITGKFPANKEGEVQLGHVRRVLADKRGSGLFASGVYRIEVPTALAPGWGGRLSRKVVELLDTHVLEAPPKEAKRWLRSFPGVGEIRAEKFIAKYGTQVRQRLTGELLSMHQEMRRGEDTRALWRTVLSAENSVLEQVYLRAGIELGIPTEKGETDEPVTADIKRLIRLPGSLHGKSGLKVVTLTRETLDGFEPLRDAVAFSMDPVRIIPRNDQEMVLGGERVAVQKGETVEVPEAHAVFWLARQAGTVA